MKRVSFWAKHHVLATRIIVTITHVLLILIAYYISQNLQFNFSVTEIIIVISVIIIAHLIYPFAKRKSYVLHKTILFITSTCFFLIMLFAMKNNFAFSTNQSVLSAVSLPFDSSKNLVKSISSYKDYKALSKAERKAFRKELKKTLKAYKALPRPQRPSAQDALLIFLIVLCGIGLLYLLAVIVCSISCGGIPGSVILLSVLGIGGIGVGLYFIIRSLHRNIKKEGRQMDKQTNNDTRTDNLFPFITT